MLVLQLQTAPRQPSHTLFKTLNTEIVYLFKTQVPKNNTLHTYPLTYPFSSLWQPSHETAGKI